MIGHQYPSMYAYIKFCRELFKPANISDVVVFTLKAY